MLSVGNSARLRSPVQFIRSILFVVQALKQLLKAEDNQELTVIGETWAAKDWLKQSS